MDFIGEWIVASYEVDVENLKKVKNFAQDKIKGAIVLNESGFGGDLLNLMFIFITALGSFALMCEGSGDLESWLTNFDIDEVTGTPPNVSTDVSEKLALMEDLIEKYFAKKKAETTKEAESSKKTSIPQKKKGESKKDEGIEADMWKGSSHLSLLIGGVSWVLMVINFFLRFASIIFIGYGDMSGILVAVQFTIFVACCLSLLSAGSLLVGEKLLAAAAPVVCTALAVTSYFCGGMARVEGTLLLIHLTTSCLVAGFLEAEEEAQQWVKRILNKVEKSALGGTGMYFQAAGLTCVMDPRVLPCFSLWIFATFADTAGVFVAAAPTTATTSGTGGTSAPAVSITASNGLALLFLFISISTAVEFFVSATGSIKQAFTGSIGRPSSWLSLGKARGSFDILVSPFVEAGGGFLDEEKLKNNRAISCFAGVKGVLNNLPTASKLRAQLLTGGIGYCFSIVYLSACSIKYGRIAEKKAAGSTRAASVPQHGVKLSRRMYKELRLGSSFNGIASSMPEIGLLEYQSSGKSSPSLLRLSMDRPLRHTIESSVARGLGAGSRLNGLIAKAQEQSSTSELAFSFGSLAAALTSSTYSDQHSWSIALSYMIVSSLFLLNLDPQGTVSEGMMHRIKDGMPINDLSCAVGQRRMSFDMFQGLKACSRVLYQAAGVTVLRVTSAIFAQASHFAGSGDPSPKAPGAAKPGPESGKPGSSGGMGPGYGGGNLTEEQKKKIEEGEKKRSEAEEKLHKLLEDMKSKEEEKIAKMMSKMSDEEKEAFEQKREQEKKKAEEEKKKAAGPAGGGGDPGAGSDTDDEGDEDEDEDKPGKAGRIPAAVRKMGEILILSCEDFVVSRFEETQGDATVKFVSMAVGVDLCSASTDALRTAYTGIACAYNDCGSKFCHNLGFVVK